MLAWPFGVWDKKPTKSVSIVRVPGGSVRYLTDAVAVTWSPDGESVGYSTADGDINLIRSDGTGVRTLARVGGSGIDGLSWSPDGKTMRFFKDGRPWEMSSNGSNLHELLHNWRPSYSSCCGQWTPDGEFFIFMAGDQPSGHQIWALDDRLGLFRQHPAEPVKLTSGPLYWGDPLPCRDGKKIFADGFTYRGELVRFDSKSGKFEPFLKGISAQFVDFSKDGKSVVYVSFPEGVLWRASLDGTKPVQLSDRPMYPVLPRWSPDGSQILFMADTPGGQSEAYIVSSSGGTPRLLLPEDKGAQDAPNWSPDGRRIAFSRGPDRNVPGPIYILDLATHHVSTPTWIGGVLLSTVVSRRPRAQPEVLRVTVCLSASVPALGRTRHPFAVSGLEGPSQKIEFVFSASPETIRREPREGSLLRSVGNMQDLAVCAFCSSCLFRQYFMPP
jgi:Tol biopolymer transport system component